MMKTSVASENWTSHKQIIPLFYEKKIMLARSHFMSPFSRFSGSCFDVIVVVFCFFFVSTFFSWEIDIYLETVFRYVRHWDHCSSFESKTIFSLLYLLFRILMLHEIVVYFWIFVHLPSSDDLKKNKVRISLMYGANMYMCDTDPPVRKKMLSFETQLAYKTATCITGWSFSKLKK